MDDIGGYLYIIIGLIVFIVRILNSGKKKKQESRPTAPRPQRQPQQGGQQQHKTFEELLREFSQQHDPEPEPQRQEPQARFPREKEVFSYETADADYDDDEAIARYEKSIRLAQDSHSIDDLYSAMGKIKPGRMQPYALKSGRNKELEGIRKKFSNPGSLREAVIFKEILDRKYT